VVTRAGAPPGGAFVGGRAADLDELFVFNDGHWSELQLPPSLAASDLRLDGVLDARVDAGDIDRRGVHRVAGRPCQAYRLGGPITGGTVTSLDPASDEHADVCVDEDGLVLSERWVKGDTELRRRTAVDVEVDVDFDKGTFDVQDAEPVPATDGGGSSRPVTDDSRFGNRTWTLPDVPDGFDRLGQWVGVWPKLEQVADPMAPATEGRVAGLATVWTNGPDVLVVDQGASADESRPFTEHPDGERVDLGTLDLGEVVTDGRGTEVRVAYVDGSYVRILSTLPRDDVLALARSLEPGPGGTPTYVDG
jgi:hypothetical protein